VSPADWIVLSIVLLSGLYGFSRGLVRGALSLAGFAVGAYLGAKIGPQILPESSPYVALVALGGALLGGTLLSSLAEMLGVSLRRTMGVVPGLRAIDSGAGLLLGALAGVVLCWAIGAVLLWVPGQSDLRQAVQRSAILGRINEEFPPQRLLETLEGVDPLGVLVGPPVRVGPPNAALARDPEVVDALDSVVRITGISCGLGVEGSGWIARPGIVVTNAHVVAGIERPRVDRGDGGGISAHVIEFDEKNDLAILRVPGLTGRPLPLADPKRGVAVVLLGYPANGPLSLIPGRLGDTSAFVGRDAYGRGPVTRTVTAIRATVRPGLSGGPGVDGSGRVRTVVFARRAAERGGYGVPPELVREALQRSRGAREALVTDCTRK
jgi:S1-C subfamily serine protease